MELAAANLDELYTAHSVYLRRYMHKLTGNQEEAADLVQEIFLKLCQQDNLPEHPKAWLSRTGYRLFVDHWRRRQRRSRLQLDEGLSNPITPEQALLDMEFDTLVRRLLLRFQPRTRTAFYLRIYKHFSYGEIAKLLGCSENTIKSCMRRGKAQLLHWLYA